MYRRFPGDFSCPPGPYGRASRARGGLIAQCEWELRDPADNVAAVFEAWDEAWPAWRKGQQA